MTDKTTNDAADEDDEPALWMITAGDRSVVVRRASPLDEPAAFRVDYGVVTETDLLNKYGYALNHRVRLQTDNDVVLELPDALHEQGYHTGNREFVLVPPDDVPQRLRQYVASLGVALVYPDKEDSRKGIAVFKKGTRNRFALVCTRCWAEIYHVQQSTEVASFCYDEDEDYEPPPADTKEDEIDWDDGPFRTGNPSLDDGYGYLTCDCTPEVQLSTPNDITHYS